MAMVFNCSHNFKKNAILKHWSYKTIRIKQIKLVFEICFPLQGLTRIKHLSWSQAQITHTISGALIDNAVPENWNNLNVV